MLYPSPWQAQVQSSWTWVAYRVVISHHYLIDIVVVIIIIIIIIIGRSWSLEHLAEA